MKKTKPAIISGIILLVGILMLLTGINGEVILNRINSNPMIDPTNITADNVNKVYDFRPSDFCYSIDVVNNITTYNMVFTEGDSYAGMPIGVKVKDKDLTKFKNAIRNPDSFKSILTGKICMDNEATKRKVVNDLASVYKDWIKYSETGLQYSDLGLGDNWEQDLRDNSCPYFIMLESKDNNMIPFYGLMALGILVIIIAVIVFVNKFCGIKGKHIALGFVAFILILVITFGIMLSGKIRTYMSITDEAPGKGLYKMNVHYNMKTNKLIDSDISSEDEFIQWIAKNQLYGIPLNMDTSAFGCATFTAQSPEGDTLFGRNFDYSKNDALIIYNNPGKGYASIGVVATNIFGLDSKIVNSDSVIGKLVMMVAPYATLDGMNEAGLGIGILELNMEEVHQDNGQSDIVVFTALRCILDTCANVDEALALLESHDMHTSLGFSYHLYITDKSGRSVVVEWLDGEMVVTEDNACTNSILAPGSHYGEGGTDERYGIVKDSIADSNGVLSKEESMAVLSSVAQKRSSFGTQWSCVYNLNDFTMDICLDTDYETVYSYSPADFK